MKLNKPLILYKVLSINHCLSSYSDQQNLIQGKYLILYLNVIIEKITYLIDNASYF